MVAAEDTGGAAGQPGALQRPELHPAGLDPGAGQRPAQRRAVFGVAGRAARDWEACSSWTSSRPTRPPAPGEGRAFAATERCPWRGRTLIGEVHDDNTYAMGGVSGQAGLFGTIQDVAALAEVWLGSFLHSGGFFESGLVHQFWQRSDVPGSTRALGFDTPSPHASQAGGGFGPRTVGHLGFTGTSLWIDPDRELIVALLTNRVHPTRQNEAIKQFRPALHERVASCGGSSGRRHRGRARVPVEGAGLRRSGRVRHESALRHRFAVGDGDARGSPRRL